MSGAEFAVVGALILVGSCLQGTIGFGLGMLAGPLVVMIEPSLVPVPLLILATAVTALVAVRERTQLDLRGAGWALLGRLPGSLGGALLVVWLPASVLALALAGVVLVGAAVTQRGWAPHPTKSSLLAAGAASGVMGTATSIGGPPMALVWQRSSGPRLRGTMSAFFLVGCLLSLAALAAVGSVTTAMLVAAAQLAPFMVLGCLAAPRVAAVVDRGRLRTVTLIACVVGAVALVVQQLI